ncbi:Tn3 family transposase [Oscillatoriales cyanobacterium LEGE 11467]|uniref:Tn3 family transposase n=1 Tax=Zarconia navalis LEGE 11467 TaxID=1828826 RepID=A0A928VVQ2_9CYAN|nr:Tn3 family transposase [Zarconia navalis]MBE9039602.1 Tn3 family transposase [Zarconia navalis LEGE 11467]
MATTHWVHAQTIKEHYGYRDFSDQPEHWRLVRWLYQRAWIGGESPSMMFDLTTARLVEQKILLPGVTVLSRLISGVRERVANRTWNVLSKLPFPEQIEKLEALIAVGEQARLTPLEQLRKSPTRSSGPALINALHRLVAIRELGIGQLDVGKIPPIRFKALSKTAFTLRAQAIARMPAARRIATLVAWAYVMEAVAIDDALDVLDLLVKDIFAKSELDGKKTRLRTLKDLDAAALQLSSACQVLVNSDCDDTQVRERVWQRLTPEQLTSAIAKVEELARPPEDRYHQELLQQWRAVRRFLPKLLSILDFQGNLAGQKTLAAWKFLQSIEGHRKPKMDAAPLKIVNKSWASWVVSSDGSIDRRAYTFCVLEQLLEGLRRRDLFVSKGERWSNPRAKLLQGQAWESARASVCRTLNLNPQPLPEISTLQQQLDRAYSRTAQNLPQNSLVRIEVDKKGKESLTIRNLDKLDEPKSYLKLKEKIEALLPQVDLPEVLLEIQAKTGFMDEFTHLAESQARVRDLSISICAVLIAGGCNIGLSPLVRQGIPALTRGRLAWIERNYFRPETLIRANARLVDAQTEIPLAQSWGGGEVASADGLRFVVPVRTLNAGANRKYFGQGRGITYYNYTSDQFTGFHGLVVPGTLRDSLAVLVGLLEQQTSLRPRELMTDTSGYSDVVFGLFWLLGYQFSPRLADAGAARFWRLDSQADYGILDKLARQTVKVELIEHNWDDLLRVAGSLKLGTVSATEIVRVLHRGKKPSTIARAIGELGRITKTLYLLNYVDDEAYRRRILTQLNRGESRHSLARAVFHGRRGEVRQRYREGQEEQLGTLGLVVNALVLWNTYYMDAALSQLRSSGWEIADEDKARLSPLPHSHFNMLGRYQFSLPEELKDGGMRPLREVEPGDELVDLELW